MNTDAHAYPRDRVRAVRALLRSPLLTANEADAEDFVLVRRHATWLQEWFERQAGWPLHVEREMVRLYKRPADHEDATRPAWVRPGEPFSRRRYVLLCLALAALERMDRQTTLDHLAKAIVNLAVEDPVLEEMGVAFTLEGQSQRRDMVVVVRYLIAHHVLERVHGEERAFVYDRGDVLYRIQRPVLMRLLDVRGQPPSSVEAETKTERTFDERLKSFTESEAYIESDLARRTTLKHRMVRRLLNDPVLFYDDLTEEERDYVQRSRGRLVPELERATGLVAEIRREGIALTDPKGTLTDVKMPEEGTEGHATLLVAEYLGEHRRASATATSAPVALETVEMYVAELIAKYGRYWRKATREPGAERMLTRLCLERLVALRLVHIDNNMVFPRAALARYTLVAPEA